MYNIKHFYVSSEIIIILKLVRFYDQQNFLEKKRKYLRNIEKYNEAIRAYYPELKGF